MHRNAAAWCEERGLANDAVRHALAAGEPVWAARLMERHFDEQFYLRGEGATVYKGRLVDIASIKQAEVIVRQSEMIAAG